MSHIVEILLVKSQGLGLTLNVSIGTPCFHHIHVLLQEGSESIFCYLSGSTTFLSPLVQWLAHLFFFVMSSLFGRYNYHSSVGRANLSILVVQILTVGSIL